MPSRSTIIRQRRIINDVEIEWDPAKDRKNIRKHGISFTEASELFTRPDDLVLELYDFEHSLEEDRTISIGPFKEERLLWFQSNGTNGMFFGWLVQDLQRIRNNSDMNRLSREKRYER